MQIARWNKVLPSIQCTVLLDISPIRVWFLSETTVVIFVCSSWNLAVPCLDTTLLSTTWYSRNQASIYRALVSTSDPTHAEESPTLQCVLLVELLTESDIIITRPAIDQRCLMFKQWAESPGVSSYSWLNYVIIRHFNFLIIVLN